jgi:nicotinamidase-related amidase
LTDLGVTSTAFAERDIDYHSVVVSDACTSAEIDNDIQYMQRVFPHTARVRTTGRGAGDAAPGLDRLGWPMRWGNG